MVYVNILLFALGFILLIKGADYFVESSSRLARKFGASEFLIGMTLVAIGTSIPEIFASIFAAIKGDSGIILGAVLGGNIANIGLVLGVSTLITSARVKKVMLKRDVYIMIFASVAFYLLAFNGKISRAEGILFFMIYVAYLAYIISSDKTRKEYDFRGFLNYFMSFRYLTTIRDGALGRIFLRKKEETIKEKKKNYLIKEGLVKDFLIVIIGLIAVLYGAKIVVSESIFFANLFGISTNLIGVTVIAIGTSLPELSVGIRAAKKGFEDMVIGNVIGSNITRILFIIGITSIIGPFSVAKINLIYTIPFTIFASLLLASFMGTKKIISRKEGAVLLMSYVVFLIILFKIVV